MPWDVTKDDRCSISEPWGVVDKKGKLYGCHGSKKKAQEQQRALYKNAASEGGEMTKLLGHERFFVLPDVFSESSVTELTKGKWIQAMPYSTFEHPLYGTVEITVEKAQRFADNFADNVYKQDIPIYYEHFGMDAAKGFKAAGWVRGTEVRDDGYWWKVSFTEEAAQEIADGAWRYFSPEYHDVWHDPETDMVHTYVIVGGALTNQPFFKGMVPLNFSELLTASAAGTTPTDEHAGIEHSEPGTTDERQDDEESDANDGQGTRGPSPVIEPEDNMEEFLKTLRESLGLAEDATEESILVAASELVAEVQPIRDAISAADEKQTFSERFPAEHKRMLELEAADRKNKAHAFADRYANKRLVEGEGDAAQATPYGFSALTIENIEKMHLAFSEGKLTQEDMEAVLESLLNTGLVDYSEAGSSRETEVPTDARQAFAEKVAEIATADKIDHTSAVRLAAERHPELAKAYRETTTHRR